MRFLLLNGAEENSWKERLATALAPLGTLAVARAGNGLPPGVEEPDGLIIIDSTMVENVDDLVAALRHENPERRIVVMTASPTWQRARSAFEAGAMDYLPKTLQHEELLNTFRQILNRPLSPWPEDDRTPVRGKGSGKT